MAYLYNTNGIQIFTLSGETVRKTVQQAVKEDVDLRTVDLSNTSLRDLDLHNMNLECANLKNADLRDSDLSSTNLSNANLSNANLGDTNLTYANLSNANLRGASIKSALIVRTVGIDDRIIIGGVRQDKYQFVLNRTNGKTRVQVGCKDFSAKKALKYWDPKTHRDPLLAQESRAIVKSMLKMAKIRGWSM